MVVIKMFYKPVPRIKVEIINILNFAVNFKKSLLIARVLEVW